MADKDKNNKINITPFGSAPTSTFGGVYMQPSQFATPQLQQPRYKSPTAFTPSAQPQQVQPASVDRVQPITQPISYDVTGQAGQIQLPTGGASSFVPDVRQYVNEAGNVLFIPFVNDLYILFQKAISQRKSKKSSNNSNNSNSKQHKKEQKIFLSQTAKAMAAEMEMTDPDTAPLMTRILMVLACWAMQVLQDLLPD